MVWEFSGNRNEMIERILILSLNSTHIESGDKSNAPKFPTNEGFGHKQSTSNNTPISHQKFRNICLTIDSSSSSEINFHFKTEKKTNKQTKLSAMALKIVKVRLRCKNSISSSYYEVNDFPLNVMQRRKKPITGIHKYRNRNINLNMKIACLPRNMFSYTSRRFQFRFSIESLTHSFDRFLSKQTNVNLQQFTRVCHSERPLNKKFIYNWCLYVELRYVRAKDA